jgi:hypothetical protein
LGVARDAAVFYARGEEPPAWVPGDFILTHGSALTSKLIRFGQRLRIHGKDIVFTYYNHAALVVGDDGALIEALGRGISRVNAAKYRPKEYHLVRIAAHNADRTQAVEFARWAAGEVNGRGQQIPPDQRVPQRYGFLTIVSIALTLLTGAKFSFALDGQEICSGLVARAQERVGTIFGERDPGHIMPADLAKYYDVHPMKSN